MSERLKKLKSESKTTTTKKATPAKEASSSFILVSDDEPRPPMLNLQWPAGDCKALGYPYLVEVDFNPSKAITLTFTNTKVILKGRNLTIGYEALIKHRVDTIREINEKRKELPETETVINEITVKNL